MRRKGVRATLLIVVGAALGVVGYLVSRNVVAHRVNPLEELGRDFLPRDAQFFEQEDQIVVLEPRVTFFMKEEGRQAHLKGSEGRITLEGHEMRAVTLRGHVAV